MLDIDGTGSLRRRQFTKVRMFGSIVPSVFVVLCGRTVCTSEVLREGRA